MTITERTLHLTVLNSEGQPLPNLLLKAYDLYGQREIYLSDATAKTNAEGLCVINLLPEYFRHRKEGEIPVVFIKAFQNDTEIFNSKDVKQFMPWGTGTNPITYMEVVIPEANTDYFVKGTISNNKEVPVSGVLVQVFNEFPETTPDLLGRVISDSEGKYRIDYTDEQIPNPPPGGDAYIVIKIFTPDGKLLGNPTRRKSTANRQQTINIKNLDYPPQTEPITTEYTIKGKILSDRGEPRPGLIVELFNQGIPGKPKSATPIGNPILTCGDGSYEIKVPYQEIKDKCKKDQPDITVRVSDATGNELYSTIQYNSAVETEVPIELPKAIYKGIPEFQKLRSLIQEHLEDLDMGQVKEREGTKGITYLSRKTKWDARLVAMNVLSTQYADEAAEDIPEDMYYTLFRAGVPSNKDRLYRMNADKAVELYETAVEKNIIPDKGLTTDDLKTAFRKESVNHILASKPSSGVSTMDDMLSLTLTSNSDKKKFVEAYYHGEKDLDKVWEAVEQKLGATKTQKLRLDGKLGFLTFNNAPLIQSLKQNVSNIEDPVELVQNGYYKEDAWDNLIEDDGIPEVFTGDTIEERKDKYKGWLAGQLKRAYPTKVIAERVKSEEFPLTSDSIIRQEVYDALQRDEDGFKLGSYAINEHIKKLEDGGTNLDSKTKDCLKKLHRTYQLSPSDEAMKVLLEKDLDSAFKISRYGKEEFIAQYKSDFGDDEHDIQKIYDKAIADASLITNVTMSYLTQKNNPLPAMVAPMEANSPLSSVKNHPTMEALFGSLDYCSCGHCESVLSPAAYFVELLEFIDKDYVIDIDGTPTPLNVQSQLFQSRPDLGFLELTCENTNTVLPYIDLVNEILEFYIVNNSLDDFKGYNIKEGTSSEELLASPQNVKDTAYSILKSEVYPLKAPFNRPLELVRGYFNKLDLPYYQVLEAFRKDETLSIDDYGWQQIFAEQLKISTEEYKIFTDHSYTSIQALYGLPAGATLNDEIANAQTFTRTTDISYDDLVALLKTEFINPGSRLIPKLEKLQWVFNKSKEDDSYVKNTYGSKTLFEILYQIKQGTISIANANKIFPPIEFETGEFIPNVPDWIDNTYNTIKSITFLTPNKTDADYCRFEDFDLKYTDPNNGDLEDLAYWKFIRFIRLRNKLNWSIEDTDIALKALHGGGSNDVTALDMVFKDVLTKLALFERTEKALGLNRRNDFQKLLSLFGVINSYGSNSLYHQMFLRSSILEIDNVFQANDLGEFLTDASILMKDHKIALQAALKISEKDWELVANDLPFDMTTAVLNFTNITFIYRYSFLANALKTSISELIDLKTLSNLSFSVNYVNGADYVKPDLLKLIELAQKIKASDFSIQDLNYLLRHLDATGDASPSKEEILLLVKTLNSQLKDIEKQYLIEVELTTEEAKNFLIAIYGEALTEIIFSTLENLPDVLFEATYTHSSSELEEDILDVDDKISYDDIAHKLYYQGAMKVSAKDDLKGVSGVSSDFKDAVDDLFDLGRDKLNEVFEEVFALYPEIKDIHDETKTIEKVISENIDPLVEKLKKLTVGETLGSALSEDPKQIALILDTELDGTDRFVLDAEGDIYINTEEAAIYDCLRLSKQGISAKYYKDLEVTDPDDPDYVTDVLDNINFEAAGQNELPGGNDPVTAIWEFYLKAPANGFYKFYFETDNSADNIIIIIGETDLDMDDTQGFGTWQNQIPVELFEGQLYQVKIIAKEIQDKAILKWQRTGTLVELIPPEYFYPAALVNYFEQTYLRLLKALRIANGFNLGSKEIFYFSNLSGAPFLNLLPIEKTAINQNLFNRFSSIVDYTKLKELLKIEGEHLIDFLLDPDAKDEDDVLKLSKATNWSEGNINNLLTSFSTDLTNNLSGFYRILAAYQVINQTGADASDLISWITITPNNAIAANFQRLLKSKYSESAWLNVIQPINDKIRQQQRDALVNYVLKKLGEDTATAHIDTPDKLFEYFLIDVEMNACMKTSRIKQGISSVQLFIHRCLMNLEVDISPDCINAKEWDWMKRYRVWEAARKIFLFPEIWLDSSLRSTKSPFFKEFEGQLLQSDINEELATKAFLDYLEKLDKVSWLEVCGMCKEDEERIHVIYKTPGMNREYYHRVYDGTWSAFEKIDLDIEDGPVIPVFWKDRLFLFWATFIRKGREDEQLKGKNADDLTSFNGPVERIVEVNLNWSEFYNAKWQPKRTSNFNNPVKYTTKYPKRNDEIALRYYINEDSHLIIYSFSPIFPFSFKFVNKHSQPNPKNHDWNYYSQIYEQVYNSQIRSIWNNGIWYFTFLQFSPTQFDILKHKVLGNEFYSTIDFSHVIDMYNEPFFRLDQQHVFFVNPDEVPKAIAHLDDFGIEYNHFNSNLNINDEEITFFDPENLEQIGNEITGGVSLETEQDSFHLEVTYNSNDSFGFDEEQILNTGS